MAFLRNILFCLSDVSLQRYGSANRRPILEKTLFHTVGSCTLWPKQLTCLADGGGWREDQHMWDGQGLKDPFFSYSFHRITKSWRKAYFMREKLGSFKRNFFGGGLGIFLDILTHFRAFSFRKEQGSFCPLSFFVSCGAFMDLYVSSALTVPFFKLHSSDMNTR